jgi:hypothetical protein
VALARTIQVARHRFFLSIDGQKGYTAPRAFSRRHALQRRASCQTGKGRCSNFELLHVSGPGEPDPNGMQERLHMQRTTQSLGQDASRHFMARHESSFPEILDVASLRAKCDFIASAHAEQREPMRQALLAAFRQANVEGRAKARELLSADGAGIKCAFPGCRMN